MNRKLISKAISDMDDSLIAEAMIQPVEDAGYALERTTNMDNQKKTFISEKSLA